MLLVHSNVVFENMTGFLWVVRQPSLMFFFLQFLPKRVFWVNGRYIQNNFLQLNSASFSENNDCFSTAGFNSRLPKHRVKVPAAVSFIEVSSIYCHICHFRVDTINDTFTLVLFKLTSGFPFNLHCYSCTYCCPNTQKHEQTSAWIYIHEKLEILSQTDSYEPNYASKFSVQEESVCMSLYPKLFKYRKIKLNIHP